MAGEKYIVAASDNPLQISIRNILNPAGYTFLANCSDAVSLLRLIRSYQPDFVVIDGTMPVRDLNTAIEIIDGGMLCACIILNDFTGLDPVMFERTKVLTFCPRPPTRELLVHTAIISIMNYRRISELERKLKQVNESYETRKSVERAKWILMDREGVSENEAYERIRRKSMDSRLSMREIADALIFTNEMKLGKSRPDSSNSP